jgi:hypothetical protein
MPQNYGEGRYMDILGGLIIRSPFSMRGWMIQDRRTGKEDGWVTYWFPIFTPHNKRKALEVY